MSRGAENCAWRTFSRIHARYARRRMSKARVENEKAGAFAQGAVNGLYRLTRGNRTEFTPFDRSRDGDQETGSQRFEETGRLWRKRHFVDRDTDRETATLNSEAIEGLGHPRKQLGFCSYI